MVPTSLPRLSLLSASSGTLVCVSPSASQEQATKGFIPDVGSQSQAGASPLQELRGTVLETDWIGNT